MLLQGSVQEGRFMILGSSSGWLALWWREYLADKPVRQGMAPRAVTRRGAIIQYIFGVCVHVPGSSSSSLLLCKCLSTLQGYLTRYIERSIPLKARALWLGSIPVQRIWTR